MMEGSSGQKRKSSDNERTDERKSKYHKKNSAASPENKTHKTDRDVGGDPSSISQVEPGPSKISKLLKALDEALESNAVDGSFMSEAISRKCRELRASLQDDSPNDQIPPDPSQPGLNIPKTIPATLVTAWKSSEIPKDMPPLPPILNKTLETACFTHTNAGGGKVTDLNYERLEWVGDTYLELTATLLIAQTFPAFSPGKSSQLRERLVRNSQLSQYARFYEFDKRANLGPNFVAKADDMMKISADIFEAYVAAVILSDPENGISMAVEWLKGVWGRTISQEIAKEERKDFRYRNPMWHLPGDVKEAVETTQEQAAPMALKDQLQKALGAKGIKIYYEDIGQAYRDRKTKLPVFTVGVFLDGWGEKGKQLGYGSAGGKKEAGAKAAQMVLKNKKLMAVYLEKKRLFHEQMELEREALEAAGEA
ncbi:hypothetical protein HYALB_00013157 [Hymenoscyphus albidus]|uniref:RNase III domain-containing protein n=1 Tax=Hymenoscyphus albidus TaxID=595503 RepID=A0A9N9LSS6_9HELO|nr:hypothetical protein HYALB_00013157 [Hymenoscyphus albidus]